MTRSADLSALYDDLVDMYEAEWDRRGHRSLHLGIHDDNTDGPADAAMNTMRVLAEAAAITEDDRVLNIGCGAGEDAIWNARMHGATVTGVDIGTTQLTYARENAANHDVGDRVSFAQDDFHELSTVPDESVDVVWALEALSHSHDRAGALTQAHRVLVPDGRLAVADIFCRGEADDERIQAVESAMGLHIGTIDAFEATVEECGFVDITVTDYTDGIRPCTKRRRRFARVMEPVGRFLQRLGSDRFTEAQLGALRASSRIHELVVDDVLGYYILTARRD